MHGESMGKRCFRDDKTPREESIADHFRDLALMLNEMRAVWGFLAKERCDLIYKSSLTKDHSSCCVENRQF